MRNIYLNIINLIIILFISSCSSQIDDESKVYWEKAMSYHDDKQYDDCLVYLNKIVDLFPSSSYAPEANYIISEIYLNEFKEFDISILYLDNILKKYPTDLIHKKALFTIGYINANYIESYSDAINYYNEFLKKYPNDDLIPSVNYELDNLKIIEEKIILINNS